MAQTFRHMHKWLDVHRFLFLLFALMSLFILHPLVDEFVRISFIFDIFLSFVLLSAIYAVGKGKGMLIFALLTALPALGAHWSYHFLKIHSLNLIDVIFAALFFGFTTFTIISHLFKEKRVTLDLIIGAVCGYFLIGLMWAFLFSLLQTVQPGSFSSGRADVIDINSLIYFSFVTLCTIGYGDITPLTTQARFLAILEAVMGQMYLAVNIAALVAIRISQSSDKNTE